VLALQPSPAQVLLRLLQQLHNTRAQQRLRRLRTLGLWWAQLLNNVISIFESGAAAAGAGSFESIATYSLSSAQSSVTFSSIPQTYKHLQVRGIAIKDFSTGTVALASTFNGVSGSSYTNHQLYGNGTSAGADGNATGTYSNMPYLGLVGNASSGAFGAFVIDILDYTDTNKYTTVRSLNGLDVNGSGQVQLVSSLFTSTNAITSITFFTYATGNLGAYSHFALYGIKGA